MNFFKNKYLELLLGIVVFLLIFVSFMPKTISISYMILGIFLISLIYINKDDFYEKINLLKFFNKATLFLCLFLFWIITQPFIFEDINFEVFSEIKAQFIVPLLFFLSGIFLVLSNLKYLNYQVLFNIIFFTGFIHVFIVVIMAIFTYFKLGILPIRESYLLEVREMSYFSNLIYSLFLAEIYNRAINKKSFLFITSYLLPVIFSVFVFSVYLQGMRWGVVTFTVTSLFFLLIFFFQLKLSLYKKMMICIPIILVIISLIYNNIKYDQRWNTFNETINIVFNDQSLYWVNETKYPCPKLLNGNCVDESNYLRLSQFINGLKMGINNPQGVGFSRYSYKDLLLKTYGEISHNSAFPHSGIINLFIGVGVIGIVLYFMFIFYLLNILIKFSPSYPKIFTIFFIVAFHSRSIVDMTFMNHNLKVFFFVLGIGIISSLIEDKKYNKIEKI